MIALPRDRLFTRAFWFPFLGWSLGFAIGISVGVAVVLFFFASTGMASEFPCAGKVFGWRLWITNVLQPVLTERRIRRMIGTGESGNPAIRDSVLVDIR